MVITIDGPAGAGKTTVARALAARLGYRVLDTGAMYRAVTLAVLRDGGEPGAVARAGAWRALVADPEIRSAAVDEAVSRIAQVPDVRMALRAAQREFLAEGDAVCEGRDIGEVVWPQAELKVWLDADPGERARRRGDAAALTRDARDVLQTRVPADAVVVDTTGLDVGQVVERIVELARARGG